MTSSLSTLKVMAGSIDRPLAPLEVKAFWALACGLPKIRALRPSQLNLPIDDNPDSTADRKQVLLFTKEGSLRDQAPAFAAGLPRCYHASLARTWSPVDSCGEASEQDRRNVEATGLPIILA